MGNPNVVGGFNDESVNAENNVYSLAKVFGYLFLGLLITAVTCLGLGAIFQYLILNSSDPNIASNAAMTLFVIMGISGVTLLVFSFVIPITAFRGKHNIKPLYIIYACLMGVVLSTFAVVLPWSILGMAFIVTSLAFGVMALIAKISKGNMNGLAIAAIGLVTGALILSLVTWIEMLLLGGVMSYTLMWIVNFALFGAMMLITIVDMVRIKNIANSGGMNDNLSLYCAFTLYNDFIYIFVRVLYYILIIATKNK